MTRKHLSGAAAILAATMLVGGCNKSAAKSNEAIPAAVMPISAATDNYVAPSADEVIQELLAGNERFVKGTLEHPRRTPADFQAVADSQYPVAAIVACADSRVAPELLFDTGVGELFVIRVAGNVVDGAGVTVKGSIEYAIAELHVPLIVVLGHSNCGAVKAAIEHIDHNDSLPGAINGLVELIKPAVVEAKTQPGELLSNATRANVNVGVEKLKGLQPIIAPRVNDGSVKVVGGMYDLHTGKVELIP
jgi:carbonic anhydrase